MQSSLAESQEILINLRRAGGERVDMAEEIIDQCTDAKLGSLTLDARLGLLESLYDEVTTPPKTAAVKRILLSLKPDPAYGAQQSGLADDLAVAMQRDPTIASARREWETLSNARRVEAMQRLVDIQADLGGFRPAQVIGYEEPSRADGRTRHGFFDPMSGTIHINLHADAQIGDFASVIGTVTHENCHNGQKQLARAWESRSMTDADPRRSMAQVFATTLRHQTAILARNDYDLYRAQPIEVDANAFGMGMTRRLTARAIPDAILKRLPSAPPSSTSGGRRPALSTANRS